MSVFHNNILAGAAGAGGAAAGYQIDRSLRFNSADSAYLNRTPSSAGNRRTWTWSAWVKRSKLGAEEGVFSSYGTAHPNTAFVFNQDNTFQFHDFASGSFNFKLVSNRVLRDTSAWYHIIVAVDTTMSIAAYRLRISINGTLLSSSDYSTAQWPSENFQTDLNSATRTDIGHHAGVYFNGYMADIHFIDGQQLDAVDLGGFDDNGVWQAKEYTGSYGTNGYHINFSNVTSAASIGEDSSGNDNDFTVNNISPATIDYASGLTTSGGAASGYAASKVFDSNTNNFFLTSGSSTGTTWTFTPPSSIAATSLVIRVSQGAKYRVNGGSYTTYSGGSSGELTLTSSITGGAITSIEGYSLGNYQIGLWYIKVNGNVLTSDQGASTDVLFDSPTNGDQSDTGAGGEVSGNYCTFNPLKKSAGATLSNGNLQAVIGTTGGTQQTFANFAMSSGKWYWEIVSTGTARFWGIAKNTSGLNKSPGEDADSYGWGDFHGTTGEKWHNGSYSAYGTYPSAGDVVGVAFDADNGTLTYYVNGTSQGTAFTGITGTYFPVVGIDNTTHILNAGQRAFAYSAPSNHKALCTANLSTPNVAKGSDHNDAITYTGNGGTQTISGYDFQPDFVWYKYRSGVAEGGHYLFDSIRGATNYLRTDRTAAEDTYTNSLTAFTSSGFSVGNHSSTNYNNDEYISWAWKAASSTSSNSDGSISSQVRANQSAGFSIVKWTGTGSAGTVGHGLGAKPEFIFTHSISNSGQWPVYHSVHGATKYHYFNSNIEARTYQHFWNNTEPTSSVFSIGSDSDISRSGGTHIAYCFAPVAGYSAVGEYAGNSSSDGPFVHTNFRPAWVMVKAHDGARDWMVFDSAREPFNVNDRVLSPNTGGAEMTPGYKMDFLSNGFKLKVSAMETNNSALNYLYVAFAENPFQANGGLAV